MGICGKCKQGGGTKSCRVCSNFISKTGCCVVSLYYDGKGKIADCSVANSCGYFNKGANL